MTKNQQQKIDFWSDYKICGKSINVYISISSLFNRLFDQILIKFSIKLYFLTLLGILIDRFNMSTEYWYVWCIWLYDKMTMSYYGCMFVLLEIKCMYLNSLVVLRRWMINLNRQNTLNIHLFDEFLSLSDKMYTFGLFSLRSVFELISFMINIRTSNFARIIINVF